MGSLASGVTGAHTATCAAVELVELGIRLPISIHGLSGPYDRLFTPWNNSNHCKELVAGNRGY